MKRNRLLFCSLCSAAVWSLTACSGGSGTEGITMDGSYGITASQFASGQYKLSFEGGNLSFSIVPNLGATASTGSTDSAAGVQGVLSYDAGRERGAMFSYEVRSTDEEGNVLAALITINNIQAYEDPDGDDVDYIINNVTYNTGELSDKLALLTALGYTVQFNGAGFNNSSLVYSQSYWNTISSISMPSSIRIYVDFRANYAQNQTTIKSTGVINPYTSSTVTISENIQMPEEEENQDDGNADAGGEAGGGA